MAVARYYDESKNPDGGALPGVPLRDLDDVEFDALPAWLQASVDAASFYRKTRPDTPKAIKASDTKE
jgi:hypothetical protein